VDQGPGNIDSGDPFMAAAHWVAPGLGPTDTAMVGGKLPMTLSRLADLIKTAYMNQVQKAWDDAVARGESGLPSKDQIFSTDELVFHEPS